MDSKHVTATMFFFFTLRLIAKMIIMADVRPILDKSLLPPASSAFATTTSLIGKMDLSCPSVQPENSAYSSVYEMHIHFLETQICSSPCVVSEIIWCVSFALSDVVKHRQGLSKLWSRDENLSAVMSVTHCVFTGEVYKAFSLCIPRD